MFCNSSELCFDIINHGILVYYTAEERFSGLVRTHVLPVAHRNAQDLNFRDFTLPMLN